jgi:molybdenum cofactor cytidylyltransferase
MAEMVKQYGIVILAGGQSSRLGSPKQLLSYQNNTLLRHAVRAALGVQCNAVLVVTGANDADMVPELNDLPIHVVHNPLWQEGMASTLRKGLETMRVMHPEIEGIILMVCDQPFVTKSHLLCLIEEHQKSGKAVTASAYGGKAGTPAFFHCSYFDKLIELKGDKGARALIASYPEDVSTVDFEKGAIDIDTKEDYEQLLKS